MVPPKPSDGDPEAPRRLAHSHYRKLLEIRDSGGLPQAGTWTVAIHHDAVCSLHQRVYYNSYTGHCDCDPEITFRPYLDCDQAWDRAVWTDYQNAMERDFSEEAILRDMPERRFVYGRARRPSQTTRSPRSISPP